MPASPIIVPADARGRRFRIASSVNARLFAEAIGADAIPLGFAEIVPSLQTGLIEAGENSVTLYARTGIAGEAPHLTLTHHLLGVSLIVARKSWWDALPAADRQVLEQSFPPVGEYPRGGARAERGRIRCGSRARLRGAPPGAGAASRVAAGYRRRDARPDRGHRRAMPPRIDALIRRGKAEFQRQSSTAVPLSAPRLQVGERVIGCRQRIDSESASGCGWRPRSCMNRAPSSRVRLATERNLPLAPEIGVRKTAECRSCECRRRRPCRLS